jgi:hypothetical protein
VRRAGCGTCMRGGNWRPSTGRPWRAAGCGRSPGGASSRRSRRNPGAIGTFPRPAPRRPASPRRGRGRDSSRGAGSAAACSLPPGAWLAGPAAGRARPPAPSPPRRRAGRAPAPSARIRACRGTASTPSCEGVGGPTSAARRTLRVPAARTSATKPPSGVRLPPVQPLDSVQPVERFQPLPWTRPEAPSPSPSWEPPPPAGSPPRPPSPPASIARRTSAGLQPCSPS